MWQDRAVLVQSSTGRRQDVARQHWPGMLFPSLTVGPHRRELIWMPLSRAVCDRLEVKKDVPDSRLCL